ncbi:hypothetical protein PsorP6_016841 [Peronosclerospora sorghi]|uniref:Uncharacterized protein n=1 Tax=Peronosclerospora sorghi TaxID=230839 RepID=A0ACC0WE41_9STRA|nr:hypothetical protein PsorP6_016841 [Peronosclerospora sorghi]
MLNGAVVAAAAAVAAVAARVREAATVATKDEDLLAAIAEEKATYSLNACRRDRYLDRALSPCQQRQYKEAMDFLNKAKEAAEKYAGGEQSNKNSNQAHNDSFLTKALDAVEKYHVKEKAVEFAQKEVAKREEEKRRPGYVETKDKSVVEKAIEAAEDFLAKQGDKMGEIGTKTKTKTKDKDKKSEHRDDKHEKRSPSSPQDHCYKNDPNLSAPKIEEPSMCPPRYNETGYSGTNNGDFNASFERMNLDKNDAQVSGGNKPRYETYQEYWSRQNNAGVPANYVGCAGDSVYTSDNRPPFPYASDNCPPFPYASENRHHTDSSAWSPNLSRPEENDVYYRDARCVPGYAGASSHANYSTVSDQSTQYGALDGTAGSQFNNSESSRYEEYLHRNTNTGEYPPSNWEGAATASSAYERTDGMDSGYYETYNPRRVGGMQYASNSRYTSTEHV